MQLPLILRGILNIYTCSAGMGHRRMCGAVGADGPGRANWAEQATASAGSTVANRPRTAANQPVAHEMGKRGGPLSGQQQRECDQVKN
jgi:hypothetical protein